MPAQVLTDAMATLGVALVAAVMACSYLRRRLQLERATTSDLRRRMRRVTMAALVTEHVSEADVQELLHQDRPITVDEVAGLLEQRQGAA